GVNHMVEQGRRRRPGEQNEDQRIVELREETTQRAASSGFGKRVRAVAEQRGGGLGARKAARGGIERLQNILDGEGMPDAIAACALRCAVFGTFDFTPLLRSHRKNAYTPTRGASKWRTGRATPAKTLARRPATIDGDRLPSRECGAFAAQPEHGAGNLLRSPEATDGRAGFHRLMTFVAVSDETLQHRRHDRAGADRLHGNAPPGIVVHRRLGETHDAVLGGNISGHRRDPPQSRDRGAVDDRAAALAQHLPYLVDHALPDAGEVYRQQAVPILRGAFGGFAGLAFDPGI